MRFEIEAGGRVRDVSVSRTGGVFAVTIDGRQRHVDAVRIDAQTVSMIVDAVVYDAALAPEGGAGRLVVRIGAVPVPVLMSGRRRRSSGGTAVLSGPLRMTAPMPGKIVRLLVHVGDRVRAGQPVVVIEAMKMENELRADRDGTVAEIQAREGTTVESGASLVLIQ